MTPRLPWEPLWELAEERRLSLMGLARATGANVRCLHRWRAVGSVPEQSADRLAVALGVTPELVWGVDAWAEATAYLIAKAERQEVAAAERKRRRNSRRWQRYLAVDPSRRERKNEGRRAAYWANRDRELARQRAYDQARKDERRAYRERKRLEAAA